MTDFETYLNKAQENIAAAEILLQEGFPGIAVSRAYYAMFYLAEALLFSKGLSFSSHTAVIAAFGKEFAKPGLLKPEHHRHLIDAFETRQAGDYIVDQMIPSEKAVDVINWAKDFLTSAKEYFNNRV